MAEQKDERLERLKELSKNQYRNVQEEEERRALAQEYPQFDAEKEDKAATQAEKDVPQTSPSPSAAPDTRTGVNRGKKTT